MTTNEQRQAIAKYEDLAENGTLRPADRQDLKHLLTVISEQTAKLDAVRKVVDDKYRIWAAVCSNTCSKELMGVDHDAIADEIQSVIHAAMREAK